MTSADRLYLDHAATTPLLPQAREAVARALDQWANPSSPHADGRKARAALEEARRTIAAALGWRHDVILTSGASEALAIVLGRTPSIGAQIVSPTEHDAVWRSVGPDAVTLAVTQDGRVDLGSLEKALSDSAATPLVIVQHANNETGVIQPLDEISAVLRERGAKLLADCAQTAGKIPLPDADFIAVSAHKLGGPPGIGALLVKDLSLLSASGGQERGYRAGTENLPAAAGFAAALQAKTFEASLPKLQELRNLLEQAVEQQGGLVVGKSAGRSPLIGAYAMPGVASATQLVQFDLAGISVSAGSACSSGSLKASRVLEAMRLQPEIAACVIRVSFGPATGEADVDRFLAQWRRIRDRAGARAA